MIEEGKLTGKALVFNQVTSHAGPGSNPTEFSEARWGARTRFYAESAAAMKDAKFVKVCELAKEYAKTTQRRSEKTGGQSSSSGPSHQALLVDIDSDENCKSFVFFAYYCATHHLSELVTVGFEHYSGPYMLAAMSYL